MKLEDFLRRFRLKVFSSVIFCLLIAPTFAIAAQQKVIYQIGNQLVEETFQISADQWPDLVERKYLPISGNIRSLIAANETDELVPEGSLESDVGGLWEAKASWSWQWEIRYAEWIQKEVDPGFLKRHGVATDCADVAYALRWIFSRIHSLPMSSRLATGHWFTHKSLRPEWKRLPTASLWHKDQRFLKALDYLLDLTYTHSLARDTYPILVQEESLLEGTIQLYINDSSGHTQILTKVRGINEPGIPVEVLQSTVPRAKRDLFGGGYWNRDAQPEGKGGLVRFRWPQGDKNLVPAEKMPFFSLEQYSANFTNGKSFFLAVFERIQPNFSFPALLDRLYADIVAQLEERRSVVEEGYRYCQKNSCEPGTIGDENWSTPSRDKRLMGMISELQRIAYVVPGGEYRKFLAELMKKPFFSFQGKLYSLETIEWLFSIGFASADARVAPELRWALGAESFRKILYQKAISGWSARQQRVKEGVCPPSICQEGSENWIERSSMVEDLELRNLKIYAANFCSMNSSVDCSEWLALKQTKFPIVDANETLEMALNRFLFLNSDPRLPTAKRSLDPSANRRIVVGPYAAKMFTNSQDLLFATSREEKEIWDVQGKPLRYSFSGKVLAADLRRERVWLLHESLLTGQSIRRENERVSISVPFQPVHLEILDNGDILLVGEKQLAVLREDSAGLQWIATANFLRILHLDNGHKVLFHPDPVYYDFQSGNYAGVLLPASASTVDQNWTDSAKLGWFVHSENNYYFLKRGSGEWVEYLDTRYLLSSEDGLARLVLVDGSLLLQRFDQSGIKIAEQKFPARSVYSTGEFAREIDSNRFFIRREADINVFVLPVNEDVVAVNDGQMVGFARGEYSLKEMDSGKVLYRSRELLRFPQAKNSSYILSCTEVVPENNTGVYRSLCRLVDMNRQERYSVLTGLSPVMYWQKHSRIAVGTLLNFDRVIVWLGDDLSSL